MGVIVTIAVGFNCIPRRRSVQRIGRAAAKWSSLGRCPGLPGSSHGGANTGQLPAKAENGRKRPSRHRQRNENAICGTSRVAWQISSRTYSNAAVGRNQGESYPRDARFTRYSVKARSNCMLVSIGT